MNNPVQRVDIQTISILGDFLVLDQSKRFPYTSLRLADQHEVCHD
jgi:hypothetical protein